MQQKYDLLLKGGEVIDPSQNMHGRYDVALAGGEVASVSENIPREQAKEIKDVSGKLVTPGLIDIHGHFYHSVLPWCIDPDRACIPNGVTSAVDAGTAGPDTFPGLRKFIVAQSETRLYSFLHTAVLGMAFLSYDGEGQNLKYFDVDKIVDCIERNRDTILGIKARIALDATGVRNAMPVLKLALEAGEKASVPIMAHFSYCPIPVANVVKLLRPGDIITHILNHRDITLNEKGDVRPELLAAADRGVIMDVGHGMHLDFQLAQTTIEQGLMPHVMSTDVIDPDAFTSFRGVRKAPTLIDVMSQLMAIGVPLETVVRGNTVNAASAIGLSSKLGTLRPGAAGDVTVLELQEGNFTYTDWRGNSVEAKQKLAAVMTVREGRVVWQAHN
jgi:dihydroorotase